MSDETYYSLLEIPETAQAEEIKGAYHRLIREVHPDRLANAPAYWQRQAEEKAKEINEAFSVLSNREKRRLYDAQLDAYRKSQSANTRTTPAQTSNPPASSPGQQHSHPSSGPQNRSGFNSQSAQRPQSARQAQGAWTSAQPPNSASKSGSQRVSTPMGPGQRFLVALIFALFGFGSAGVFWDSPSKGEQVIQFLLAMALFGVAAYLYRRRICPLFAGMGLSRLKHQIWATTGIIALALVIIKGTIARTNPDVPAPGPPKLSAAGHPDENRTNNGFYTPATRANSAIPAAPAKSMAQIWQSLNSQKHPRNFDKTGSERSHEVSYRQQTKSETDSAGLNEHQTEPLLQPSNHTTPRTSGYSVPNAADQASIEAACTIAYSQGPATYHRCKSEQVAELANHPVAPYLGELSASDRNSIEAACTIAYSQGPATYHQCQSEQVTELAHHPIGPYLGGLSASDRNSVEAACTIAYSQGPATYHRCESEQIIELTKHPNAPNLGGLSASDRNSIEAACTIAYSQGPATYYRCESRQLVELTNNPNAPNLDGLSASDRNSIEAACTVAYSQGPATYHQCLRGQLHALASQ